MYNIYGSGLVAMPDWRAMSAALCIHKASSLNTQNTESGQHQNDNCACTQFAGSHAQGGRVVR